MSTAIVPAAPGAWARFLDGDVWHSFRSSPTAIGAAIVALVCVFCALFAGVVAPHNPFDLATLELSDSMLPPAWMAGGRATYLLGTDEQGRDVFSALMYGARISLMVGFVATAISLIIGIVLGAISGFYGGATDSVVMRLTDVFLAFPYILLAILLISLMGMGLGPVLVAIGILGWTTIARVFRSSILSVKQNDYVEAARAMGASDLRIMARHILPNALAPIIVYATMSIGGVILTEAALSFLGVGIQPPTPSWGRMLNDAQSYIITQPALFIWPGLAIILTVLAFVLLGDGLRDALDVKVSE